MTNKKNFLIISIFIIFSIILILNPNILISSVNNASLLFFNKLFTTLFPFFILSEILLNYNFHYYLSKIFNNIFVKLFNINKVSVSIVILSLLTGHPSNAKYIKDYLDDNLISEEEANKLLIISCYPNPIFVITVVGYGIFNSVKIGFLLLITIYLINFILGMIIKNKINIVINENKVKLIKSKNLGIVLKKAIINSFNTLMIIFGNIIIFNIIFNVYDSFINFSGIFNSIVASFIELTNGIKKISELNTNFNLLFSLCIFALTFSSLSIHSQIYSILSDYKINYKKVLKYRLITSIISPISIYLLLKLIHLFH